MTIIRAAVLILGLSMQLYITYGLLNGQISYSVGDIAPVDRTTSTMGEAVVIFMTFSPIFVGLILAGVKPRLYIEKPWLIKCLLGIIAVGYLLSNVLYP